MKPETEKAAKRQPVNMCQIASGGAYPVSDTVKSPKITLSNMENYMSGTNKPSGESKPQPAPQPKPAPQPVERNLRTGWTVVGDSADGLRRKGK